ncbi:MAG: hypothetical protein FJ296_01630 [Planctomycetes bacterium]|nr:hypothetical protein [Planctomycetota bacterium]
MMFKACRKSGEKRPAALVASAAAALAAGLAVALADRSEAPAGAEDATSGSTPWVLIATLAIPLVLLVVFGVTAFVCWRKKQEQ